MPSAQHTPRIGLIGLGIMGIPMGLNLLKAGFPLAVYARRPEAAAALVAQGARFYSTPAALAAEVEVVISIVSDTPDVEMVLFGTDGVIQGARPHTLVIDMSTISPVVTRQIAAQLAQQQLHFLDAPVSGGEAGAKAGTLTIMVGGEETDFDFALPIFQAMGKTITHIGAHGAGQITKACNQLIIGQTVIAIAEAFALARQAGVDAHKVREALLGGFAASKALDVHGLRILTDNYQPGFKAKLHQKDLLIVADTIQSLGLHLPATQRAVTYMQALVAQGDGELDSSAIAKIVQQHSQTA